MPQLENNFGAYHAPIHATRFGYRSRLALQISTHQTLTREARLSTFRHSHSQPNCYAG
jgi:hypothetical protein